MVKRQKPPVSKAVGILPTMHRSLRLNASAALRYHSVSIALAVTEAPPQTITSTFSSGEN